ncbi:hypothetical protein GCM10009557_05650 [Virgisporangium ochraceum]|uniref:DUF397 domain-containing protein n=1 Tax=Virgisporangium ochraceum TaxID=65505 RepID=A0A8J4ECX0_9ACTN|nr:DUF397 domain-containing protein [Virgisporangium ochraceum]GIJ69958.1 hypothetical protein Voc01_048750 [Virgisporangium ochraceum]
MNLSDATWRKSSRSSGGGNGDCVEVAIGSDSVMVRDSKQPSGPVLAFTPAQWQAFITAVCHEQLPPTGR